MTKKDYELIADVFAGHLHSADTHVNKTIRLTERDAIEGTALSMADAMERTNPRFDRVRFLAACGITA